MTTVFGGNLLLLDKLAAGGMGEVFRAKQVGAAGFEKIVAVKRILPQFINRSDFERMFRLEMNLCANLQHSNIVQVFSNGHDSDYIYLVMEFIDGKNIGELLSTAKKKRARIPIECSCYIISEAAKGLHHAHTLIDEGTGRALEIVHRDVSPQNIMFSYTGNVKVCDFGIAKAADRSNMTKQGDLKGKVPYVSPEHIDGLKLDARADVFSLGIVLYELLAQRTLFAAPNSFETLKNIKEQEIPSLSDRLKDVPRELELIVLRALERDREIRYQNAEQLFRDLIMFLNRFYPAFAQPDFAKFIKTLFREHIALEQRDRKNQLGGIQKRAEHYQGTDRPESSQADLTPPPPTPSAKTMLTRATKYFVIALALTISFGLAAAFFIKNTLVKAQSPGTIPGLIGWYDAANIEGTSGERVAEWKDFTTTHNDLLQPKEQSRPTLYEVFVNSKSAISFDGSDDFIASEKITAQLRNSKAISVSLVAKVMKDEDQYLWSIHEKDKATDVLQMGTGFGQLLRLKVAPTKDDSQYLVSERVPQDSFAIYTTIVDEQSVRLYLNGMVKVSGRLVDSVRLDQSAVFSVGQEYDAGVPSGFFKGEIAELTIFKSALTTEERKGLERFFATKYGITY